MEAGVKMCLAIIKSAGPVSGLVLPIFGRLGSVIMKKNFKVATIETS